MDTIKLGKLVVIGITTLVIIAVVVVVGIILF